MLGAEEKTRFNGKKRFDRGSSYTSGNRQKRTARDAPVAVREHDFAHFFLRNLTSRRGFQFVGVNQRLPDIFLRVVNEYDAAQSRLAFAAVSEDFDRRLRDADVQSLMKAFCAAQGGG